MDGEIRSTVSRFLIPAAAFVIVVAGMKVSAPILVPILLSAFIAVISANPLFWLKRKGVPMALAMVIVVFAVLGIGVAIAAVVGGSLQDFSQNLPSYQARVKEKVEILSAWLAGKGMEVARGRIVDAFDPGVAMRLVSQLLTGLGNVVTNGFLIILTVIFILLETSGFPQKLKGSLRDPEKTFLYFERFIQSVQRYMAIKTWISLGTGVVIALWLAIIGVDYPVLWGLLAFLLNYIPNIGSILAAIPAVLLALIQLGIVSSVLTAIGYLVVNVVFGNIVEPRVMGRGLGLSTLIVFLSLIFWGWVFGPVGMLLSVPLTMTLKIALDSSEDTWWIAALMGSEPAQAVRGPDKTNR